MALGKVAYNCAGDGAGCPGAAMNSPIDVMCEGGGFGVACAECPSKSRYDGNVCTKCEGTPGPAILIILVCMAIPVAIKRTLPVERDGKITSITISAIRQTLMTGVCFNVLTGLLQSTMVFTKMSVEWPTSSQGIFDSTAAIFNLKAFSLGCILANGNSRSYAVLRTGAVNIAPLFLVLFFASLFFISKTCQTSSSRFLPDRYRSIASLLAVMVSFFMTIVNEAVNSGFAIYQHPATGSSSLAKYPWLLTSDGDAKTIQFFSIAGLLLWCVGFLSLISFIIVKLPSKSLSAAFRLSTANIFVAFHAKIPWWMMVYLLQSVLISLSVSMFTSGAHQMSVNIIVIVLYTVSLACFEPYYFPLAYYDDLWVSIGKLLILTTGGSFIDDGGEIVNLIAVIATYSIAAGSLCMAIFVQLKLRSDGTSFGKDFMKNMGGKTMSSLMCKEDFEAIQPYAQKKYDRIFNRQTPSEEGSGSGSMENREERFNGDVRVSQGGGVYLQHPVQDGAKAEAAAETNNEAVKIEISC
jgi:hypothetical protein